MGQFIQKPRQKHWATCSSVRSLPRSWESEWLESNLDGYFICVFFSVLAHSVDRRLVIDGRGRAARIWFLEYTVKIRFRGTWFRRKWILDIVHLVSKSRIYQPCLFIWSHCSLVSIDNNCCTFSYDIQFSHTIIEQLRFPLKPLHWVAPVFPFISISTHLMFSQEKTDSLIKENYQKENKSDRGQTSDAFWRSAGVLVSELSF